MLTRGLKRKADKYNKFTLLLGMRHRSLGAAGTALPTTRFSSDEVRVSALNAMMGGSERVITLNKQPEPGNKHHLDCDFKSLRWLDRLMTHMAKNFGSESEVNDVYLDYFGLQATWYRESYGEHWAKKLANLKYSGTAYLPVYKQPGDSGDRPYMDQLVEAAKTVGGNYITNSDDMDNIRLCHAGIQRQPTLRRLQANRTHFQQMQFIDGFVTLTRKQARKLMCYSDEEGDDQPAKKKARATVAARANVVNLLKELAKSNPPAPTTPVPPTPLTMLATSAASAVSDTPSAPAPGANDTPSAIRNNIVLIDCNLIFFFNFILQK